MLDYLLTRAWTYKVGTEMKGWIKEQFYNGVHEFIRFAKSNNRNNTEIRCPCSKCQHLKHWKPDIVEVHLYQYGFVPDYYFWDRHGELVEPTPNTEVLEDANMMRIPIENMVDDATRSMLPTTEAVDDDENAEEEPTS